MFLKRIKRKIARRQRHTDKQWERLQQAFSRDWPRISKGRRVELHLPSLSLPEQQRFAGELNIGAREDLQLGRIVARALDPSVFVSLRVLSAFSCLLQKAQYADSSVVMPLFCCFGLVADRDGREIQAKCRSAGLL
jgi:hypothetical protein